jgi:hypothetical protein
VIVNNVAKPCTGCTLIGVTPDLVYTDGTRATISNGPMLHHVMFTAQSSGKSDVTCAGKGPGLLGGRRRFGVNRSRDVAPCGGR